MLCSAQAVDRSDRPIAAAKVTPALVSDKTPLIAGTTAEIGIHLKIEPGWHVYWDGQNDTGLPVAFSARFPEGFEAGEIRWPGPSRHVAAGGILDHIYETEVTLLVPVKIPESAAGQTLTLPMDLNWLVCRNVCLPEEATVEIRVEVARPGTEQHLTPQAPLIEHARARLPRPFPSDPAVASARWQGPALLLTGQAGRRIEFYPGPASAPVVNLLKTGASDDGRLSLRFDAGDARVSGVLAVWTSSDAPPAFYRVDLASPAADNR